MTLSIFTTPNLKETLDFIIWNRDQISNVAPGYAELESWAKVQYQIISIISEDLSTAYCI